MVATPAVSIGLWGIGGSDPAIYHRAKRRAAQQVNRPGGVGSSNRPIKYVGNDPLRKERAMIRLLAALWLLTNLAAGMAWAQPAQPSQEDHPAAGTPKLFNINKFVPSGDERRIAFVPAVFPDCSSKGLTVGRVTKEPTHGAVGLVPEDSFPDFPPNGRYAPCNEKKVPGLRINYKSDNEYVGQDDVEIFLMFPDGSAAIWHFLIVVK